MIKCGSPPFLECSSAGDKRFSAFYARPSSLGGKSIEEAYQAMKVLPDGRTGLSWREAKGRAPVNREECIAAYDKWWLEWITQENLLSALQEVSGLSDKFGKPGHVCQADTLWRIRNGEIQ